MALLVVGALQAVHVEVHQQHLPVAALRAAPDLVDLGEEATPVEQAGELVDVRQAAQELLELLVRRDAVADRQAEPAAADVDDPRGDLDRHALAVARDLHGLVGERAGLGERLRASADAAARLGGEDVLGGHRQQLGARVAEGEASRLVDLDELPGRPSTSKRWTRMTSLQASKSAR